jgi:hypothetical protein
MVGRVHSPRSEPVNPFWNATVTTGTSAHNAFPEVLETVTQLELLRTWEPA